MAPCRWRDSWNETEVQEARKCYLPCVVNKAYCHLMLGPKWGEEQYDKCLERCEEALRLGRPRRAELPRAPGAAPSPRIGFDVRAGRRQVHQEVVVDVGANRRDARGPRGARKEGGCRGEE